MGTAETAIRTVGIPERCVFAEVAVKKIDSLGTEITRLRGEIDGDTPRTEQVDQQFTNLRQLDYQILYLLSALDDCASCERYPSTQINKETISMIGCMGSQVVISEVIRLRGNKG